MAAEKYFDRAIIKDKSRPDAYVGLAEIYLDQMIQTVRKMFI